MTQNYLVFPINHNVKFVEGSIPVGIVTANSVNKNSVFAISPFKQDTVMQMVIQPKDRRIQPQTVFMALTDKLSPQDLYNGTESFYELIKDWYVWEAKIPQVALTYISSARNTEIGFTFYVKQSSVRNMGAIPYGREVTTSNDIIEVGTYGIVKVPILEYQGVTYNLNDAIYRQNETTFVRYPAIVFADNTSTAFYHIDPAIQNDNFEHIELSFTEQVIQSITDLFGRITIVEDTKADRVELEALETRVDVLEIEKLDINDYQVDKVIIENELIRLEQDKANETDLNVAQQELIRLENEKADITFVESEIEQAKEDLFDLVSGLNFQIVDGDENGLPIVAEPLPNVIYLLLVEQEEGNNFYNEFIWLVDRFEFIGNTAVDLTDYYKKGETNELLDINYRKLKYPNTKNTSGVQINKGDVVQFAGSQGDFILIKKAVVAEIIAMPKLLMGIAEIDIPNGEFGDVIFFGNVGNLSLSVLDVQDGDILWFDNVTGGLTKTEPLTNKIIVAAVQKAGNNGNGILLVRIDFISRNIAQVEGLQTALNNKLETSLKGSNNGIAELDNNGKVPASQLPSYVDEQLLLKADKLTTYTKTEVDNAVALLIPKTDIVNDLTSGGATKVLSAEQGKVLDEKKVNHFLDQPIAELNNHTLREVFENGNLVINGDFTDTTNNWNIGNRWTYNYNGYLTYDNTGVGFFSQEIGIIETNQYYFNVNISGSSGNARMLLANNSGMTIDGGAYREFINGNNGSMWNANLNTSVLRFYATTSSSAFNVNKLFLINTTALGLTTLTKQQLDYYFNLYQLLKNYGEATSIYQTFAPKQLEAFITPTLTSATSSTLRYRKDNFGTVIIEGNINVTTATTNFTLPLGYRPSFAYDTADFTFNTNGTVVSKSTGNKSLSVRFTAV